MGTCFSSHAKVSEPMANLVLMDGSIREFSEGVMTEEILGEHLDHFICNSDGLYIGRSISQVLSGNDQLQAGHLYFLLPVRKLEFVVTESDMAALLLKANSAINQKKRAGKSRGKIQPLFDLHLNDEGLPEIGRQESWEEESCRVNFCGSKSPARRCGKNNWPSNLETIVENV